MDPDAAFLGAILEAPDDDTPRLIYADWLEEHGDPRAEFIRAQCALARLPADDERRPDLEACEARLLAEHGKGWAGPIRRWAHGWTFRRGFVAGVKVRAETFLARADDLFATAPIRHVRLVRAAGHGDELAACPHLARLDSLDLHANFTLPSAPEVPGIPGRGLPAAVWSARWRERTEAIRAAKANCQAAGVDCLRRLLGSRHLKGLRALGLEDNRLGGPGIRALLDWDGLDELTDLDLRRNDLGVDDVQALVESSQLGRLRRLRLGYCRNEDPSYAVGNADYVSVPEGYRNYDEENEWEYGPGGNYFPLGRLTRVVAPLTLQLSALELGACGITQLGLQDFTTQPQALTRLSLHHNFIGLPGSRALASSPLADRLTSLDLSSCYIDDRSLAVLARCPRLSGLTALELGNHQLGVEGIRELPGATFAARLVRLGLAGSQSPDRYSILGAENASQIQDAGVKFLAEGAGRLPRLAWLDLRKNGLGAAAIRSLADSPLLEQLAWLDLRQNRLGDEGASRLAVVVPWPRLARLDLRDNGISPAIGHRLRARFGARVLYSSRPQTQGTQE